MSSPQPLRLLFVCLGNICRSPSAENVMRSLLEAEGLEGSIEIDSAGIIDYHTGKPPDPRMIAAAARRGIRMTGSARQVREEDFGAFDWILAMDRSNYDELSAWEERRSGPGARIALFCDFCERHDVREVPDPYYGGPVGFETVLDLLEDGCAGIIRRYREGALS